MGLKIIQITASYKPAYIYGGPIQSVGKLCEALTYLEVLRQAQDGIAKDDRMSKKVRLNLEVLTTTANGQTELDVEVGEPNLVDGVLVNYFKRWTKDHSHFSPGLLWRLREVLRHFDKLSAGLAQHDNAGSKTKNEKQKTNNDLIIHIHAWWNLVSVLSCLIAKWYKVPVVLSPRGMLTSYTQSNRNSFSKKILHLIIGKSLLKYVHVHATSDQEKNDDRDEQLVQRRA
ncbi:MAG: hypothetical protein EOO85_28845, partial [Pedobacter sp.]